MLGKFILLYLFIVLLPSLLVNYFFSNRMMEKTMDENYATYSSINDLLLKNLQFYFTEMDNLSNSFVYNPEVFNVLAARERTRPDESPYLNDSIKEYMLIEGFIKSSMFQPACVDFGIYTMDGRIYHLSKYNMVLNDETESNYTEASWFKKAIEKNGKSFLIGTHTQMQVEDGDTVFSFVKLLKTPGFENLAVVLIDYDFRIFGNIFDMVKLSANDNIIIADENGTIVYDKREQLIRTSLDPLMYSRLYQDGLGRFLIEVNGEKFFVASSTDEKTGWRFISMISYQNLIEKLDATKELTLLTALSVLTLVSIIYLVILQSIIHPIRSLSQKMFAASQGDLTIRFHSNRNDEVGMMAKSFNHMIASISSFIDKERNYMTTLKNSEIRTLQAQINPHFMYNTLNTVKWMAIEIHAQKIQKTIEALVSLLRTTINRKGNLISLDEEIENLNKYIYIQNMRYNDRYLLTSHLDAGVGKNFILKMLLQPIVENAIFHGFQDESLTECILEVACKKVMGHLTITISDNGIGMDEATLSTIGSDAGFQQSMTGLGLSNVRERIKLNYGDAYDMCIESTLGVGTSVTLTLPCLVSGEGTENA